MEASTFVCFDFRQLNTGSSVRMRCLMALQALKMAYSSIYSCLGQVIAQTPKFPFLAQSCRATKRLPTAGFDPQRSFPVHWKSSISASVAIKSHFLKIYGIFHIVGDGDE